MTNEEADARRILRHTVATLAYRAGKAVREAPEAFGALRISETSRTPCEILGHVSDLMEWALSVARGSEEWRDSPAGGWPAEVTRFFGAIGRLDEYLASDARLFCPVERLFQGPVADALTHVGQLTMLRRMLAVAVEWGFYGSYGAQIFDDQIKGGKE